MKKVADKYDYILDALRYSLTQTDRGDKYLKKTPVPEEITEDVDFEIIEPLQLPATNAKE